MWQVYFCPWTCFKGKIQRSTHKLRNVIIQTFFAGTRGTFVIVSNIHQCTFNSQKRWTWKYFQINVTLVWKIHIFPEKIISLLNILKELQLLQLSSRLSDDIMWDGQKWFSKELKNKKFIPPLSFTYKRNILNIILYL